MSDTAQAAVIQEHCKELKLAAVVRDYPALCRQARDGGWAYEDLLRELLEAEVTNRRQSTARRLLREARFPDVKTLEQIDWPALKGVSRPKILELSSCQYIGQAEDVILAGPIGTGKTCWRLRSESKPHAAVSVCCSPGLPTWCRAYWRPEMSDG
jgi:DNA replication protein DnaC